MTHSALLEQFLGKLQTPRVSRSNPEIQHELVKELNNVSDLVLANSRGPRVDCVRSLLLLQAGDFERSHAIVQAMSESDPAYIHGMIHRVEGDFWNAKYWFRRSKKHPAFLDTPIDPFRITDLVEQAKGKTPSPTTIQDLKVEFGKLLDFLLVASASG